MGILYFVTLFMGNVQFSFYCFLFFSLAFNELFLFTLLLRLNVFLWRNASSTSARFDFLCIYLDIAGSFIDLSVLGFSFFAEIYQMQFLISTDRICKLSTFPIFPVLGNSFQIITLIYAVITNKCVTTTSYAFLWDIRCLKQCAYFRYFYSRFKILWEFSLSLHNFEDV